MYVRKCIFRMVVSGRYPSLCRPIGDKLQKISLNEEVCLLDPVSSEPLAILRVKEKYEIDKTHECRSVFATTDEEHPGVRMVMQQGAVNLAGPVTVLATSYFDTDFSGLFLTPAETRSLFQARGWTTVAAFQTRNPMHRSHEISSKNRH